MQFSFGLAVDDLELPGDGSFPPALICDTSSLCQAVAHRGWRRLDDDMDNTSQYDPTVHNHGTVLVVGRMARSGT